MDYFKRIIDLFTAGDFTESGKQAFGAWLGDEEHAEEKAQALHRLWRNTTVQADAGTRRSWRLFRERAGLLQNASGRRLRMWQSAAAMLLLVTVSSLYLLYRTHATHGQDNLLEQYVPVATMERLVLPDGSEVLLNAGSLLLYPPQFSGKSRSVYLSGEANFKVKADKKKPFVVKSNDFRVTVLGTEFDMQTYPEDSLVKVTLLSGSVLATYNNMESESVLLPNQQLVYNKHSRQLDIVEPDMEMATAWQRGEIVFKGATLNTIIPVLKRKYPYDFVYDEERFENDTYTFRFSDDAPIEEVMAIIAQVVGYIDYNITDNTCSITLRK